MIYFTLPVYNEEKNIKKVIDSLRPAMSGTDYKIIAVNDGSSDGSLKALRRLSGKRLAIETYKINMNVGAVFTTAIASVLSESNTDDIMVIMESDQTSSINLVPRLIKEIEVGKQDIVIASRYQRGGRYQKFPLRRLILSKGANHVFQLLFPVTGVRDYSIFYRAYRVQPLQDALKHYGAKFITAQTFFANIDILLNLRPFVSRIEEVPFVYNYSQKKSQSSMKILANLWSYVVFMVRYAFRHRD